MAAEAAEDGAAVSEAGMAAAADQAAVGDAAAPEGAAVGFLSLTEQVIFHCRKWIRKLSFVLYHERPFFIIFVYTLFLIFLFFFLFSLCSTI